MNEQNKKQIIIAGVLGVVLVGVLVYQLVLAGDPPPAGTTDRPERPSAAERRQQREAARATDVAAPTEAIEIDMEELIRSVEVQPINYAQVKIRRNPMEPLVGIPDFTERPPVDPDIDVPPPVARRPRVISGIIWDEHRPIAIIDNTVVHEGYVFADGVQVFEIEPTRVLLKEGDTISPVEIEEF